MARRVSSPVLVGRTAEVAQLQAALERAAAGRPATVVVAGEAGVGKTRLVAELVRQAGGLGAVALTGGCLDVGDGVLAYAPPVEVLTLLADGRTNRQIAEELLISDKTASVHVSNILAKLGVANRGDAAAVAHRLHLTG